MKDIKDYLHLYIGCQCQRMGQEDQDKTFKLTGISWDGTQNIWWAYFEDEEDMYSQVDDVFPVLRPLSSMTEEEFQEFKKRSDDDFSKMDVIDSMSKDGEYTRLCHSAFAQQYLLSKGFDLFGLIESGLALEKKN